MKAVRIKVEGMEEIIKRLRNMPDDLDERLAQNNIKYAVMIQTMAKKNAPADTGNLRAMIKVNYKNRYLVAEIISGSKYSLYVEKGSRPHYPPIQPLRIWARRHHMAGLEYAIQRTIARKGTKPQPFLFPAYNLYKKSYIREVQNITRNVSKEISE